MKTDEEVERKVEEARLWLTYWEAMLAEFSQNRQGRRTAKSRDLRDGIASAQRVIAVGEKILARRRNKQA